MLNQKNTSDLRNEVHMSSIATILVDIITDVTIQTSFVPTKDMKEAVKYVQKQSENLSSRAKTNKKKSEEANKIVSLLDAFVTFLDQAHKYHEPLKAITKGNKLREEIQELLSKK